MCGGGSRGGPGVVSNHVVSLDPAVDELPGNGDLGHAGEVGEPGVASSAAGAPISRLILEASVLRRGEYFAHNKFDKFSFIFLAQ